MEQPVNFHSELPHSIVKPEDVSKAIRTKKAVLLKGPSQSGKTTLALKATYDLAQREDGEPPEVFFTIPALQQTFGRVVPVTDRTGVVYKRLPSREELKQKPGTKIIVVDEISQRKPYENFWQG